MPLNPVNQRASHAEWERLLDLHEPKLRRKIETLQRRAFISAASGHIDLGVRQYIASATPVLAAHYEAVAVEFARRAIYSAANKKSDFPVNKGAVLDAIATMREWIKDNAFKQVKTQATSILDKIKNVVGIGVKDGIGEREIAKRLRKIGINESKVRAETIARTETARAAQEATKQGLESLGLKFQSKTWVTAQDARVRHSHANMDGVTVAWKKPFVLTGKDGKKYKADFPVAETLPAELAINCRCSFTASEDKPVKGVK